MKQKRKSTSVWGHLALVETRNVTVVTRHRLHHSKTNLQVLTAGQAGNDEQLFNKVSAQHFEIIYPFTNPTCAPVSWFGHENESFLKIRVLLKENLCSKKHTGNVGGNLILAGFTVNAPTAILAWRAIFNVWKNIELHGAVIFCRCQLRSFKYSVCVNGMNRSK